MIRKTCYYSIMILMVCIVVACSDKPQYQQADLFSWDDFGDAIPLKGEEMVFDEPLKKPMRVVLVDSILLFNNANCELFIDRFNVNTLKKTGECAPFGNGPEEMLSVKNIRKEDSIVWMLDTNKQRFYGYGISDICSPGQAPPIRIIKFKESFFEALPVSGNRVVANAVDPHRKRLAFFDTTGSYIRSAGEFPFSTKKMTEHELAIGNNCNIQASPDGNVYVLTYNQTDLIEIYNSEGNLVRRLHGPDQFFPVVIEKHYDGGISKVGSIPGETRDGYYFPVVTDNEIYVLYSGKYYDPENTVYLIEHLFVFDLNGKPLRRYLLENPIFNFTIDSKKRILYGLSDRPEFHLIKFNLDT